MDTTTEPHLKRTLGLAGLTLFGLTYMTAITVFTTYGFANLASDGHLPASYPGFTDGRAGNEPLR